MPKNLGLAQESAMTVKASTPLGGMARSIYAAHSPVRPQDGRFL